MYKNGVHANKIKITKAMASMFKVDISKKMKQQRRTPMTKETKMN